jgi:short chain dehydrogenase.
MGSVSHGFALVTPASRGLGFAFAQQLLTRTTLPVVATARKNCDQIRDQLLSTNGLQASAEKRLHVFEVDVKGRSISQA